MMNQSTEPREFDFSHGSSNPYTVEARHALIPNCIHCGIGSIVKLDGSEYFAYFNKGARIDQAFPTLTPSQREVLISGTHPECWDALFTDEEDEDS